MIDTMYEFFRGAAGLSLTVIGLGFLLEPGRQRIHLANGSFFMGLGAAYLFSWLSQFGRLPLALDNFLLIAIMYTLSQSLFELGLYLFGDEAKRGSRRVVYIVGAAWSIALWALPFLDSIAGNPILRISIEDQRPMAFFQAFSSLAIYAWPIIIAAMTLMIGRWHPSDLPQGPGAVRTILFSLAAIIGVLTFIGIGILVDSKAVYRIGHTAIEAMILAWYVFLMSKPDIFSRARKEIGKQHKKRQELEPQEAAKIGAKLDSLISAERLFVDPDIDLAALAKAAGMPAYKISAYFNAHRGSSFSDWLNAARIDYVKARLAEPSDKSILDIAFDAGYSSKTVFNHQFQRRVGMTPSEFRTKPPRT